MAQYINQLSNFITSKPTKYGTILGIASYLISSQLSIKFINIRNDDLIIRPGQLLRRLMTPLHPLYGRFSWGLSLHFMKSTWKDRLICMNENWILHILFGILLGHMTNVVLPYTAFSISNLLLYIRNNKFCTSNLLL